MGSADATAVPKNASLTISSRSTAQATAWRTRWSLKGGREQFRNRMYGNTGMAGVWLIELELIRVVVCCGGAPWIHWNCPVCSPDRRTGASPTEGEVTSAGEGTV